MLSYTNRRHLSLEKQDKAVAADGAQFDFYDDNLLAGYHFRYRKMGAVAYRHVANNYIALFQHFIPPGIWEAIYVIEGLLKADHSVEVDTVYSDTQGQSATVFAFTHLKDGAQAKDRTLLLTAIPSDASNLGPIKVAESSPSITYAKLSWLQAWRIRDETYPTAQALQQEKALRAADPG